MAYDGGDMKGLPLWDQQGLELGAPSVMDNWTFIEWLEREMETPEQTQWRYESRMRRHAEWHENTPGIFACCIRTSRMSFTSTGILTVNESRSLSDPERD